MAGVQEENRRRIALSLLGLGAVLILAGAVLWLSHHQSIRDSQAGAPERTEAPIRMDPAAQVRVIQEVLFLLLVLVGILSISLYALKRWSRRFRAALLRKPATPTASSDVWAMHQLPEELLADGGSSDRQSPEER